MRESASYWTYWGKCDRSGRFHLLPYHSLDVAACGWCLLERHPRLRQTLCDRAGLPEQRFISLTAFFLAIHDLGKFSYRFQALRRDFLPEEYGDVRESYGGQFRHDTLGFMLWRSCIRGPLIERWLGDLVKDNRFRRPTQEWSSAWMSTAAGHHGQPPGNASGPALVDRCFRPADQAAGLAFALECNELLLGNAWGPLPEPRTLVRRIETVSWWLAGLAVLSDWIGSNADLFPYHTEVLPLPRYWKKCALPSAQDALERCGVLPLAATARGLSELFSKIATATPLQTRASELPLSGAPELFVLEDVTGAGKTEAALTLAHRIQCAGGADGLYVALPTMATANAMHARIDANRLPDLIFDGQPSVVLVHSASRVMAGGSPRDPVLPDAPGETDYDRDESSAANLRSTWVEDHRKRALLADLGVGTLDQALLAVLPCKHQSLRLLGLARKVLVVDEVHAYDPYMLRLLQGLLQFQASIGASTILLSATLPQKTRQALVDAWRAGVDAPSPPLTSNAYPLLTRVNADRAEEIHVETRPEVARTVRVRLVDDRDQVIRRLRETHENGGCACWIRNTVSDAIEAMELLHDEGIPRDNLDLFHARFALGDRLDLESKVLGQFGPASGPTERAGRILIATQVVEQSLDLDFDELITDLAPMDLVIQRSGRLRRHRRRTDGTRSSDGEPDARGQPELMVFCPAPTEDAGADWLGGLLPKTPHVYPNLADLWRTARMLRQTGCIRMPEDARLLIESVFGEKTDPAPPGIEDASVKAIAESFAQSSVAGFNVLPLEQGYATQGEDYWTDIKAPTRLGDDSRRVRLARWQDGCLIPWRADDPFAWAMSELSLRASLVSEVLKPEEPALREAIERYRAEVPDKGKWSLLLPLVPGSDGLWMGSAMCARGDKLVAQELVYCAELGLRPATQAEGDE